MVDRYVTRQQSGADIAKEIGCHENNVYFWLSKHGIARRTISEARATKHWGVSGAANPMFGRVGALNPGYVDGSSPERQRMYVHARGREFLREVYKRDGYQCVRCASPSTGPKTLHAHHVRPWAGNPSLRFDMGNVLTLCRPCHGWVHSKKNVAGEYLA